MTEGVTAAPTEMVLKGIVYTSDATVLAICLQIYMYSSSIGGIVIASVRVSTSETSREVVHAFRVGAFERSAGGVFTTLSRL